MLCSLLMAVSGVHSIAYAFPRVLMITTEVDPEVNDKFYILPGIGREEGRQHDRAHTGDSHVDYFLLFPQETMATGTLERKATTRRSMRTDEPCSVVHNGSWPHCRRRVLLETIGLMLFECQSPSQTKCLPFFSLFCNAIKVAGRQALAVSGTVHTHKESKSRPIALAPEFGVRWHSVLRPGRDRGFLDPGASVGARVSECLVSFA